MSDCWRKISITLTVPRDRGNLWGTLAQFYLREFREKDFFSSHA